MLRGVGRIIPQYTPTVDSCEHSNDPSSSKRTFHLFIHLVITLSTKPPKTKKLAVNWLLTAKGRMWLACDAL
jgi:hypothetical protein